MFFFELLIFFLVWISQVQSTHFRGGFISWKAVTPSITTGSTVTITITQTYSWANSAVPCGQMIGNGNYLVCISSNCSNYVNQTSIQGPCISYDLGLDVSTGSSTTSLTLLAGSELVLAFQSTNWLMLVYGVLYPPWSLATYINLGVRSDNGKINSSPTSSMSPLVNVLINVLQVLRIPLTDIDGDVIKCRWASNMTIVGSTTIDECGGICQNIPGVQIYSTLNLDNNCTIVFTASIAGYYAVALQVEDFMPSNPNGSALSSVPLQFLVRALSTSCNTPTIIGDLPNGATVQLSPGSTYTTPIIAQIGCNGTTVTRFSIVTIPTGTASTSSINTVNASLYSIIFIWTPLVSQIGTTQLYCTMAIASNNLQSGQYCLNLMVISPTTTTSTTSTTETTSTVITTTSNAGTNPPDNTNLILGLSLGLGLTALALLGLISVLCCCRCCPTAFCDRWRRRFWPEKDKYCEICRGEKSCQTSTNPMRNSDSFDQNRFRSVSRITFLSRSMNTITPVDEHWSDKLSSSNGSLLDRAFRQQETSKNNNFY